MFWRRTQPPPAPPVQWGSGVVWLRDERLLADPAAVELAELVARICSLPDVWLVEIDHRQRLATIRFSIERRPSEILDQLAAALHAASSLGRASQIGALFERAPAQRQHTSLVRSEHTTGGWKLGPPVATGIARAAWLALAAGGFGMSVVGVIVPGIPTVPFVLLTSYFLVRSSPALNDRLLRSRLFGPLLHDWQRHGGVRRDVKWTAMCATLVILLIGVLALEVSGWTLALVLMLAAIGIHWIWRLPTLPDEQPAVPVVTAAIGAGVA